MWQFHANCICFDSTPKNYQRRISFSVFKTRIRLTLASPAVPSQQIQIIWQITASATIRRTVNNMTGRLTRPCCNRQLSRSWLQPHRLCRSCNCLFVQPLMLWWSRPAAAALPHQSTRFHPPTDCPSRHFQSDQCALCWDPDSVIRPPTFNFSWPSVFIRAQGIRPIARKCKADDD